MKKWIMMMLILLISHMALEDYVSAKQDESLMPLMDMTQFLHKENLNVTSWEVIMRRPLRAENPDTLMEKIKKNNPELQLQVEKEDKATKYMFTNPQKNGREIEQFIVIESKGAVQYSELFYKVAGQDLNKKYINQLEMKINSIKQEFFQKNTTIFSCVRSETNGNMDSALMFKKLKDFIGIKPVKMINEDDFNVFSGFTSKWNQKIPTTENREMNVQFAVRKGLGAKTTVTIGTPIITSEY